MPAAKAGSPYLATNFLADGFVCSYGKVNPENDINTYAMWLFTRSDWMRRQAGHHPRMQRKLEVLMDFYGRLDPGFTRRFFRRNCRTALSADEQRRMEAATRAIAEEPAAAMRLGERACLCNNLELYPDAIQDAEAALRLDPDLGYGYYVRGWTYARTGRSNEALADFDRSIACDPARAATYEDRARAYELLGRTDEARRDRETAKGLKAAHRKSP